MGVGCLPPDDSIPASSSLFLVTLQRFRAHRPISSFSNPPKTEIKHHQTKERKRKKERERKKELDSTSILANPQLRKRLDFLRPLRQWEKHQPFSTCLSTAKIDWIYLNDTLSHLSPPASIEIIQASIIRFSLVKYSNISPENGLISPVGERWGGRWGRRWGGRWGGERGRGQEGLRHLQTIY